MRPHHQNGSRCKPHPCSKAPHTGKDCRQQEQGAQRQSDEKKNASRTVSHDTPPFRPAHLRENDVLHKYTKGS